MIISRLRNSKLCLARILAAILFSLVCAGIAAARVQPVNKVAIIIDSSGSFRSRYNEAIQKAVELLKGISQAKIQRWETANDEIVLISLDAMPEVIWKGSTRELKERGASFWTARFSARSDYSGCTDVSGAFRVAARHVSGDPRYVHKYVFAFSDMISEPPGDSIYRPGTRSNEPLSDFPWQLLREASVSIFWAPPNQKLLWRRAAQEHGLISFTLYTPSESAEVAIQPPPRPVREYTEAERKAARGRYIRFGKYLLAGVGFFVALLLALLVVTGLLLRRRRNVLRARSEAHESQA